MSHEKKKENFKLDAAFVYAGYLVRYLGLFVLIPYYGRVLGPENYGQVLSATSLMTIVLAILGFGFLLRGARDTACAQTDEERSRVFNAHLMGRILLLPAGAVTALIGWHFSNPLEGNIMFAVLAFLIACVNAFNLGWFFQGLRKFKTSIVIDTMFYPLNILFTLTLVRGPEDGIWALWSLLISGSLCLCAAYVICWKYVKVDFSQIREGFLEIKDSTILFLNSINFTILNSGSTYILSTFERPDQVGFYGSAERFFSIALGLLTPLAQILMPTISNMHAMNKERAIHLARKGILIEGLFGLAGVLGGVILSPFLIPMIMGHKFEPSVLMFQLLICALPFAAIRHAISLYVYMPLKHEKQVLIISIVNAGTFLALSILATQFWGGKGMATARIVSEGAALILALIMIKRSGLTAYIVPNICKSPAKEKV